MAGGIQNVDAEAAVLELHHRGGDGDAPLLLDLHPVGGGGPGPLALDLAGLRDGSAVEQEFFRQGGLAGVRVGDDRKGPAALNLRAIVRHEGFLQKDVGGPAKGDLPQGGNCTNIPRFLRVCKRNPQFGHGCLIKIRGQA